MKPYLIGLLIALQSICNGQTLNSGFVLSLEFRPTFLDPSIVTIRYKYGISIIEISVGKKVPEWDGYLKEVAPLVSSEIISISELLKDYDFQANSPKTRGLKKKVLIDGDSLSIIDEIIVLDGVTVIGTFSQNNNVREFVFKSPAKGTENHKLMEQIFMLMNKFFTEERVVMYIEQLQGYFSFGLGLKKLPDTPLRCKLYGTNSSGDQAELATFLNSLPSCKEVLIDVPNFTGMDTMFYSLFKTLVNTNA